MCHFSKSYFQPITPSAAVMSRSLNQHRAIIAALRWSLSNVRQFMGEPSLPLAQKQEASGRIYSEEPVFAEEDGPRRVSCASSLTIIRLWNVQQFRSLNGFLHTLA